MKEYDSIGFIMPPADQYIPIILEYPVFDIDDKTGKIINVSYKIPVCLRSIMGGQVWQVCAVFN
jgi:hypothetical protein